MMLMTVALQNFMYAYIVHHSCVCLCVYTQTLRPILSLYLFVYLFIYLDLKQVNADPSRGHGY